VVIAHDYLTQRGGAERVVLAMLRAFPGAPVVTSVYHAPGTFPEFVDVEVRTSPLQSIPAVRRDPRLAFPVLAAAWSRTHVADADVVLASSSGWAHGLRSTAPVVVYCHNPARWLYQPHDYLAGQPAVVAPALRIASPALRRWDRDAAARASAYVANSAAVARRVEAAYGRQAQVLHPPVSIDVDAPQRPVQGLDPGYLLAVARGRGYKNVAIVREAVERHLPDARLVVVGDADPGPRTTVLPRVDDDELRWLYAHACAMVSVAREDFGLTPLEANAFGTPAVLLRAGGFVETLVEGVNGVFVEAESAPAVAAAVRTLASAPPDPERVRAHAAAYDLDRFAEQLRIVVDAVASSGVRSPQQ
jgi:glycosyltransferase involved in cell wall biosynthesis